MTAAQIPIGSLSDPDHRGRRWLQLDDCKVELSATETQKYIQWRESLSRSSDSTGQVSLEDPTESFFKTLAVSAPTSLEGSIRSLSPAHRKVSKKVRQARIELFEDQYVLDHAPTRLRIGRLSAPDSFGWRWYQCSEDLQILLPPDASIQYSSFLALEKSQLINPTSLKTAERYNKARDKFNELCIQSKSRHPVRGIASTARRYALPIGFRCRSIDKLVGRPQDICEYLNIDEISIPSKSELLSERDEYWRCWLRVGDDTQVLLPADIASQLSFLRKNGVSHPSNPLIQRILSDFRCFSSEITTEQFPRSRSHSHDAPPKLYMFSPESRSQTLDEAVAHIEVNISRSTRKQVKNTTLNPGWRGVVHELAGASSGIGFGLGRSTDMGRGASMAGVNFPPSSRTQLEEEREKENMIGWERQPNWSPGIVRHLARRRGERDLRSKSRIGNMDKELPPLPSESFEHNNHNGARVEVRERTSNNIYVRPESLWIRRKVVT